jgi:acetyltransferase-like isoleucine patch superfamily enzyme
MSSELNFIDLIHKKTPGFSIGKHTYGDLKVRWWGEPNHLTVGSFCSIAAYVMVYLGGNHTTNFITTFPFAPPWPQHPKSQLSTGKGSVHIGNDVWLGDQCVVMSGVTVGHGAVIATRAVVTKDVPPYAIVAGNPARVKKFKIPEEYIPDMLAIKWWDWDDKLISSNIPILLNTDIKTFIEKGKKISGLI